jgi:large subunit ribosomal protein L21
MRQTRGPKIIIFRRKRRKNHRRTQGHRQDLTLLKINDIAEDAKKLTPAKPAAKKAATTTESAAKKPAAKKPAPKVAAAKKPAAKKAAKKD